MKAVVIEKPGKAIIKEVNYPRPGIGEVTIKVKVVGICGTDYHIFSGTIPTHYPIIPGHEFSGEIYEVGEGVEGWEVGTRVSVDPTLTCGSCQYCLSKRVNHCVNWNGLGNTVDGSMSEYICVPIANVVKLKNSMSFEEAAFIEPMACIVHGVNRLGYRLGDRVILFGAGAIGQQFIQTLSLSGAAEIVVIDQYKEKLEFAMNMGATRGILFSEINQELKGETFDVVVDATGIPKVIENAFKFMGPTGKFLQFGVAPKDIEIKINPFEVYKNDWTIIGSMAINQTFISAQTWMNSGRIKVTNLISETIKLEDVPYYLNRGPLPNSYKIQVEL